MLATITRALNAMARWAVSQVMRDPGDMELEPCDLASYQAHCLETERHAAHRFTLLGAALVVVWWAVDVALEPTLAPTFFLLRAAVVLDAIAVAWLVRRAKTVQSVRLASGLSLVIAGALMTYMLARVAHHATYLVGFSAIFWASGPFYRWPARVALRTYACILVAVLVSYALAPAGKRSAAELAGAGFYLLSAATLMAVLAATQKTADQRAFALRTRLDRTSAAASAREHAIRLLMDSTGEGLLGLDLTGALTGTASRAAATWFGPVAAGQHIAGYLAPQDANFRDAFSLGFEQITGGFLPFDVATAQMPQRLRRDGKTYAMQLRPIRQDGVLTRVLVVLTDVTLAEEGERAEKREREVLAVTATLLRDRDGLLAFLDEAAALLRGLGTQTDAVIVARSVHTLKGNAAMCGFAALSEECHAIEAELLEGEDGALTRGQLARLESLFLERRASVEDLLPTKADGMMMRDADVQELDTAIRAECPHEVLLEIVASWRWPRADVALERVGGQIRRLGLSLQKTIEVDIDDGDIRLAPGAFEGFLSSLVHVARNVVDHGIEDGDARQSAGKPRNARVVLSARIESAALVIAIRDDGRGIDRAALAAAAAKHGRTLHADEDVTDLLFLDGLSTKTEATELSGRGVGLAAVRAACEQLQGTVAVTWTEGQGSTFAFRFPRSLARARSAIEPARAEHRLAS